MKKIFILLSLLPFLSIFTSCDNIDENDRYIEVENRPLSRKVLLEEFTGQECVNCPAAHAVIEKLEEQFGEDLIVVSIHAGSFGIPVFAGGLMQEEGDEYAKKWDVTSFPSGIVDEKGGAEGSDKWATSIRKDGYYPTDMSLDITASVDSEGKKINISTDLVSDQSVKANLQLWVVENGIVTYQKDGRTEIEDYVHNNVFRGCVNGLWGEEIEVSSGESQHFYNSVDIHTDEKNAIDNWNVANLFIVGFVYNNNGVLVVNKCPVQ